MKRKVLQLLGNLHMSGGSERQAAQLSRLLHHDPRYEVFVACLDPSGDWGKELNSIGIEEVPSFKFYSFYSVGFVRQLLRFVRFLKARNIDIVQTHDFYTNVFGMAGATLAGVNVRIASKRETHGWRTPAQNFVEKCSYRLAHRILVNADAVRRYLIQSGVDNEKIFVVYNGLDLKRVETPLTRDEVIRVLNLPLEAGGRYVTIVANMLHPVKDQETFLRAAQIVRDSVPDARFIIAGHGPLEDRYRDLAAELGISNEVIFAGVCENIAELLSISEVCVLSSRAEGFSNALLEYMGAGKPVVATDVGGAGESVIEGETGFLVRPGDFRRMGARIVELLQNPERARRMGNLGRKVVERKFSIDAQLETMSRFYEKLLNGAGSAEIESVETVIR